jgi:hypothetical protein
MDFTHTLKKILEGKRVTRKEWGDKRHYVILKDYFLQLHKAGESEQTLHPWVIGEADILGTDWSAYEREIN